MIKRLLLTLAGLWLIAPVLAQENTRFLPNDLQPITTENISQLEQVAQIGYGLINDIDWSPDGQTVALGTSFGVILYDATRFEYAPQAWLNLPDESPFYYHSVGFSSDGRWLATVSVAYPIGNTPDIIRIWDVATRSIVAQWERYSVWYYKVGFSPDNSQLAVYGGTFDRGYTVQLWDIRNLSDVQLLPQNDWSEIQREWYIAPEADLDGLSSQANIVYSPNGTLAAYTENHNTYLWDIENQQVRFTFEPTEHTSPWDAFFNADGTLLAVFDLIEPGAYVQVWDTTSGEELYNDHFVGSVVFHPTQREILLASSHNIKRLAVDTGTSNYVLGHEGSVNEVSSFAFAPTSGILTIGSDRSVEMWDIQSGVKLNELVFDTSAYHTLVLYNHDGTLLAVARNDSVALYDAETLEQRAVIQGIGEILNFAFSLDDYWLATYSEVRDENGPDAVMFWNVAETLERGNVEIGDEQTRIYQISTTGISGIDRIIFHPDGERFIIGGISTTVWNLADTLQHREIIPDENTPFIEVVNDLQSPIALSPDGQLLTDTNETVELNEGSLTQSFPLYGEGGSLTNLSYNADGSLLVFGSRSDVCQNSEDCSFEGLGIVVEGNLYLHSLPEEVWQTAFDPSGTLIVSAGGMIYRGDEIGGVGVVRFWGVRGIAN